MLHFSLLTQLWMSYLLFRSPFLIFLLLLTAAVVALLFFTKIFCFSALMEEQSIRTAALSSDLNSGLSGFWFYNKHSQISRYESGSI